MPDKSMPVKKCLLVAPGKRAKREKGEIGQSSLSKPVTPAKWVLQLRGHRLFQNHMSVKKSDQGRSFRYSVGIP